jgi:hypothetical protein
MWLSDRPRPRVDDRRAAGAYSSLWFTMLIISDPYSVLISGSNAAQFSGRPKPSSIWNSP